MMERYLRKEKIKLQKYHRKERKRQGNVKKNIKRKDVEILSRKQKLNF